MIIEKDNQYSVECQTKIATDCPKNGEYFDSEEEAVEWVEDECWINSGEGWICVQCNEQILKNLKNIRTTRGY